MGVSAGGGAGIIVPLANLKLLEYIVRLGYKCEDTGECDQHAENAEDL